MKRPTLSVLMPNYNHAKYIGEALDAILNQSFLPTEVIVSDHSSTDNSVDIIKSYIDKHKNVRMITTPRNIGVIEQSNILISIAGGEYLCFAACDDRILPGFFEKSMALLARYPEAGLCCSDPVFFDNDSGKVNRQNLVPTNSPSYYSAEEIIGCMMRTNFWIAGHTAVARKSALKEAGNFLPELKWHCDWFAFLVVAFRHGLCYIPEPLASMRVSHNSYSAIGTKVRRDQEEVILKILNLLKSEEYRDVLVYFQRSGAMSHFGINILTTCLRYPEFFDRDIFKLILTNKKVLKSFLFDLSPEFGRRLYHHLANK